MTQTNNINLKLLHNHQIHKEVLINENSVITDALMFSGVTSMTAVAPDDSPIGTKYIIPKGHEKSDYLAVKLEGRWEFIKPREGMLFWVVDEKRLIVFSKGIWMSPIPSDED